MMNRRQFKIGYERDYYDHRKILIYVTDNQYAKARRHFENMDTHSRDEFREKYPYVYNRMYKKVI